MCWQPPRTSLHTHCKHYSQFLRNYSLEDLVISDCFYFSNYSLVDLVPSVCFYFKTYSSGSLCYILCLQFNEVDDQILKQSLLLHFTYYHSLFLFAETLIKSCTVLCVHVPMLLSVIIVACFNVCKFFPRVLLRNDSWLPLLFS